jgi:hypothetical protein
MEVVIAEVVVSVVQVQVVHQLDRVIGVAHVVFQTSHRGLNASNVMLPKTGATKKLPLMIKPSCAIGLGPKYSLG